MARYRWPTVVVAATCLVLSAFSLWWVFLAYADYRSPDFTKASAGPIVRTCVESVTDDQLKAAWYDKTDWKCNDNSKEELSNLLAVSVHAMYDYNKATPYTGDSLAVYEAVVSATQGVDTGYMITREHAYATLSVLGAPSSTDCATVYGVSTEGVLPVSVAPIVACDADVANSGSGDATVTPEAADVNKLYTHCAHQFSYARSYPTKGTFGIPMVGKEAKPVIIPIIATNSTTPWEDRARIVVGTRWGYATIFYVVAMLCTAFFIMDCKSSDLHRHEHTPVHTLCSYTFDSSVRFIDHRHRAPPGGAHSGACISNPAPVLVSSLHNTSNSHCSHVDRNVGRLTPILVRMHSTRTTIALPDL